MVCHVRLPREDEKKIMETVYIAGGCLWGVQHFFDKVPGIYSTSARHLDEAKAFIEKRKDRNKIVVEVLPLTNYVRSAEEHQHHLERYPEDCSFCHIPDKVLNKYRYN